jgi:hypothetical protein
MAGLVSSAVLMVAIERRARNAARCGCLLRLDAT